MYYHISITTKKNTDHDEGKADLTEEELRDQFLGPYENYESIFVDGTVIDPWDIEKIKVAKTSELLSQFFILEGNPPEMWMIDRLVFIRKGEDVTAELIKGPPGYKRKCSKKGITCELKPESNKIFVVHGHDEKVKLELEIFLKEIGLDPIVLHRKPDENLTIIEKFEKHSNVSFSIILLTPDDIVCSSPDERETDEYRQKEYRARQNVIFEFGYFVGKLGRNRVCCLYKEGVELPSDTHGLLYKKISNSVEDIGYSLIKELKSAGYNLKM